MKKEQILLVAWNCMLAYNPNKEVPHELCDWVVENFVDECFRVRRLVADFDTQPITILNVDELGRYWDIKNSEQPMNTYIVVESTYEDSDPDDMCNVFIAHANTPEEVMNRAAEKELTLDGLKICNLTEIRNINKLNP